MGIPHEIIIEYDAVGTKTVTINGIEGPACGDVSKWLDDLGEVLDDQNTEDFYATATAKSPATIDLGGNW